MADIGGTARAKVVAAVRDLERQWPDLPASTDDPVIVPPVLHCHARLVPGTRYHIYYSATDSALVLITIA